MHQADGGIRTSLEATAGAGSESGSPPARAPLAQEGGPSPFVIVLDDTPTPEKDVGQESREQTPMPREPKDDVAQEGPAPMDVDPAAQNGDQPLTAGSQPGEDRDDDGGCFDFGAVADIRRCASSCSAADIFKILRGSWVVERAIRPARSRDSDA